MFGDDQEVIFTWDDENKELIFGVFDDEGDICEEYFLSSSEAVQLYNFLEKKLQISKKNTKVPVRRSR